MTFIAAWLIIGQDSSDHISAENSIDFTVIFGILLKQYLLHARKHVLLAFFLLYISGFDFNSGWNKSTICCNLSRWNQRTF